VREKEERGKGPLSIAANLFLRAPYFGPFDTFQNVGIDLRCVIISEGEGEGEKKKKKDSSTVDLNRNSVSFIPILERSISGRSSLASLVVGHEWQTGEGGRERKGGERNVLWEVDRYLRRVIGSFDSTPGSHQKINACAFGEGKKGRGEGRGGGGCGLPNLIVLAPEMPSIIFRSNLA